MISELHRGRLLDHVQLCVTDLEVSKHFYRAVLRSMGRDLIDLSPGPSERSAQSVIIKPK